MRITLDTNIIVSGLLSASSPPGILMRAWPDGHFLLITSRYQIDELRRVVQYPHLKERISPEQVADFLDNIDAKALVLDDLPDVHLSRDQSDDPILATAIAGHADLIVSGDKGDLLALGDANGIPIVTARNAADLISRTRPGS